MAKYKTEVGPVMEALGYNRDECERFDALAFKLYIEQHDESRERLALLIWHFYGTFNNSFSEDQEWLKKKFDEFGKILAECNK